MEEYVERKVKNAKILRTVVIVDGILWFLSLFFLPYIPYEFKLYGPYYFLFMFAELVLLCVFFGFKLQVLRCMKQLEKSGCTDVYKDISLETPTLPKSKIYCGHKAFFSKKPFLIIPYSHVAWVYQTKRSTTLIGIPVVSVTETNICCKDGKKYAIRTNEEELIWFLENYIKKINPDVIVGYTPEMKGLYKSRVKEYKNAYKK